MGLWVCREGTGPGEIPVDRVDGNRNNRGRLCRCICSPFAACSAPIFIVCPACEFANTSAIPPAIPAWHYVLFAAIAVIGTLWDLGTKSSVFSSLGYPGQFSEWTQTYLNGWIEFRFLTSFNEGALWGMGQGFSSLFALLSVLAAIGILTWLTYFRGAASLWLCVTLGLVLAGTLGNLYDRLGWHGNEINGERMYAVRDFLAFTFGTYHYPIFNFADVFLVTGAIMLGIYSFFLEMGHEEISEPADQASKAGTSSASSSAGTPTAAPESSS